MPLSSMALQIMGSISQCLFYCTTHMFSSGGRSIAPPFFGPWEHGSPHVWTAAIATNMATMQDSGGDEVDASALCCRKPHLHILW